MEILGPAQRRKGFLISTHTLGGIFLSLSSFLPYPIQVKIPGTQGAFYMLITLKDEWKTS